MRPLRIGFCSVWDAGNPHLYSGYAYSIRRALRARALELVDIFPLERPPTALDRALRLAARATGRFHHWDREPALLDALAREVERRCQEARPDVLLAPSSIPLTRVDPAIPKVFTTDQVFPSLLGSYVARPAARYRRLGMAQERTALAGAAAAVFPSAWAIEEAVAHCGAERAKLHQIAWGANLARLPSEPEVEGFLAMRARDTTCRLLFLGREWQRKGGDIVLATLAELQRRQVPAQLTIVGTTPPTRLPAQVTVIPFLDKTDPSGASRFDRLLARSQFLFVPSRAEAFGQVFCEAAAYGLPVLSTAVGGIPSIVESGATGFLLSPAAPPAAYADAVAGAMQQPAILARMGAEARRRYRGRLSWEAFAAALEPVLTACAAATATSIGRRGANPRPAVLPPRSAAVLSS